MANTVMTNFKHLLQHLRDLKALPALDFNKCSLEAAAYQSDTNCVVNRLWHSWNTGKWDQKCYYLPFKALWDALIRRIPEKWPGQSWWEWEGAKMPGDQCRASLLLITPPICICTISCTLRSLYGKRQEIPTGLEVSVSVPNQDRREASSGKELSHQQPDFLMLFPAHCLRGINRTLVRTCHGTKKGNILTCCQNCCRFLRADKRKAELVFVFIKFWGAEMRALLLQYALTKKIGESLEKRLFCFKKAFPKGTEKGSVTRHIFQPAAQGLCKASW